MKCLHARVHTELVNLPTKEVRMSNGVPFYLKSDFIIHICADCGAILKKVQVNENSSIR